MNIAISKIDNLLSLAEKIIWMKINAEITAILTAKDNQACQFVCAMGGYAFYDSDGEPLDEIGTYEKTISKLFNEYNSTFKLTGEGARWDLIDGRVIRSYSQ